MGCVDPEYRAEMDAAATRDNTITHSDEWGAGRLRRDATWFGVLASLTQNHALAIVRSVRSRCGYEAWRLLVREHEPKTETRQLAQLREDH